MRSRTPWTFFTEESLVPREVSSTYRASGKYLNKWKKSHELATVSKYWVSEHWVSEHGQSPHVGRFFPDTCRPLSLMDFWSDGDWILSPSLNPKIWEPETLMSKDRRRQMFHLKQREQIHPSSTCLFYSGPQWIVWFPPTLMKAIFFTQSTDSNPNFFWRCLHRQTQKWFYQLSEHPVYQSSCHIKWIITSLPLVNLAPVHKFLNLISK